MRLQRRAFWTGLAAAIGAAAFAAPRNARATLVRGLTLAEMVGGSSQIAVVTPLDAETHWDVLGGSKIIVTDTRVRVEESLATGSRPSEMLVRTLGGRSGDSGELVNGQAELLLGVASVGFLLESEPGLHWVLGMAQGYFPLADLAGAKVLTASRSLPRMHHFAGSAVQTLTNRPLADARRLIRAARAK